MTTPFKKNYAAGPLSIDSVKHWLMVVVAMMLAVIYVAALLGWLRPLGDTTLIARLEPIIFVLIGYYFGQIPINQDRSSKSKELERAVEKLDATQEAKELAQRERDAIAEKIHNARIALDRVIAGAGVNVPCSETRLARARPIPSDCTELTQQSAEIVRKILDS